MYYRLKERKFMKKIFIALIAFIGFLTTVKLGFIYYDANFNDYALPSFCSVNSFIDCDGIARTTESQFLGVPLAYWGMFFYLFVLLLLVADKLKNFKLFKFLEVFKNPYDYIASLGLFSFIVSITLLIVSLFEINKLCILCAFTYVLNLLIALIAVNFRLKDFVKAFKQSCIDFMDAVKQTKYLIALCVVAVIASVFLTYTTVSMRFAPQVKAYRNSPFKEFIHAKHNKYAVKGNILGENKEGVAIIYVYSDYHCPICYAHNIMIHKLAKEHKNLLIIHRNLPLDKDCNVYLGGQMHPGACLCARYSIAAKNQDKLWEMNDALFDKKPKTEQEILKIAKKLKFDVEKLREDANSAETYDRLSKEIDFAYSHGIDATPTITIEHKKMVGLKPYEELVNLAKQYGAE